MKTTVQIEGSLEDIKDLLDGQKARLALSELDLWLRNKIKYEENTADVQETLSAVREQLHQCCQDTGWGP